MRLFFRILLPVMLLLPVTITAHSQGAKYEAENGTLTGSVSVMTDVAGYSGTGYAGRFENDGDRVSVVFTLAREGFYDLYFGYAGPYGDKKNIVTVNGNSAEVSFPASASFTETGFGRLWLN